MCVFKIYPNGTKQCELLRNIEAAGDKIKNCFYQNFDFRIKNCNWGRVGSHDPRPLILMTKYQSEEWIAVIYYDAKSKGVHSRTCFLHDNLFFLRNRHAVASNSVSSSHSVAFLATSYATLTERHFAWSYKDYPAA